MNRRAFLFSLPILSQLKLELEQRQADAFLQRELDAATKRMSTYMVENLFNEDHLLNYLKEGVQ